MALLFPPPTGLSGRLLASDVWGIPQSFMRSWLQQSKSTSSASSSPDGTPVSSWCTMGSPQTQVLLCSSSRTPPTRCALVCLLTTTCTTDVHLQLL